MMLHEYEQNSLRMIFDRITPDKIVGVIEILNETYKTNHTDVYSSDVTSILDETIKQLRSISPHQPPPEMRR